MADAATPTLPFRAEHVGSLLRPRALTNAFRALREGTITGETLDTVLDQASARPWRFKKRPGSSSITDGEFRRGSWFLGFVDAVEGLTVKDSLFAFGGDHAQWSCPYCEAKVRRTQGITTEEFKFVRDDDEAHAQGDHAVADRDALLARQGYGGSRRSIPTSTNSSPISPLSISRS